MISRIKERLTNLFFYRYFAFTTTLLSVGYGKYLLDNPGLINNQATYKFMSEFADVFGNVFLPTCLIVAGTLKMIAIYFNWNTKKTFLILLLFIWSLIFAGFLIQFLNGIPAAGFYFSAYVILNLVGAYVEEGRNIGR